MIEVSVIDYGAGNLFSVQSALEQCGAKVTVTSDHKKILESRRVILPGVGAFSNAMQELKQLGLVDVIHEVVQNKTPLLGICLGMQLLLDESEEFGVTQGLGLIPGRVIPVPLSATSGDVQKIPHIGWDALTPSTDSMSWAETVLEYVNPGEAVYFIHSYMAQPIDARHKISDCVYGGHKIPAVIARGNVSGCQFHPEKSGKVGLKILQSFCGL